MKTLVWFALAPRMKTEVTPPGPPVWMTFSPGTSFKASGKVRSCLRWISSSVITVMLLPTSFSGVGKRVGVTTSGGSETDDDASAAAAVTGGTKQAIRTK